METLNVRIVQLEPMRVASAHGFGAGPEGIAWDKLSRWARQRGLWHDDPRRRYFGFNNPSPSAGSPNYGYESWMTVGPEVESEGEITVKQVPDGLYAVTRIEVKEPGDDIPNQWKQLVAWVETSQYHHARHQWLEETFFAEDPDPLNFTLDLYLPIR
jgi:DNA gyrase inhibitor GyrI